MATNDLALGSVVSNESVVQSQNLNRQVTEFLTNLSRENTNKVKQNDLKQSDHVINLVEQSMQLSSFNLNNEIINCIKDFESEFELEKCHFPSRNINIKNLRKKSHVQNLAVCAYATYFVGIANRIRRNIDELRSGTCKQKNSMLLNEMKKTPGLQIGIIGCGKLGTQLAKCFLEYAEVYPHELQISTRQPELLKELHAKNIRCYFDNKKLINTVHIVFLCVLPSQLEHVIKDIREDLPEKCIIYSLVRPYGVTQLKNLIYNGIVESFILKPEFSFNDNYKQSTINWNYTADVLDCFNELEIITAINPFSDEEDSIINMSNKTKATYIYSLINICSFLNLGKRETLGALKNFVFSSNNKNFKIEEFHLYENKNLSTHLPIVDLVETAQKQSEFSSRLDNHKSIRKSLAKNFLTFFEEINAWRSRNLKSS